MEGMVGVAGVAVEVEVGLSPHFPCVTRCESLAESHLPFLTLHYNPHITRRSISNTRNCPISNPACGVQLGENSSSAVAVLENDISRILCLHQRRSLTAMPWHMAPLVALSLTCARIRPMRPFRSRLDTSHLCRKLGPALHTHLRKGARYDGKGNQDPLAPVQPIQVRDAH
jgi:hypothetical protein